MKRSKAKKKLAQLKPDAPRRSPWTESLPLQLAAIVLLCFAAYWNSIDGGFHFDDQGIFLDPYIMSPGFGWGTLRLMQTRPLTFLSFHWNYLAGGANPLEFHWVNVLLHAANAALVLLIGRRELRGYLECGYLGLLAAALFASHPLQTQAVNYVFERATLLAAFFALLSLLLFLKEKRFWSVAAFGLSLLAKEETIALPAFLLLYEFVRKRRPIRWGYYAGMFGLVALVAARLFYVLHTIPEVRLGFGTKGIPTVSYALSQSRVVWIYLLLFLFPVGLTLDHDVTLSRGLFFPLTTFPALLFLVLSIGALAWLAWRQNVPALWALGFFVLLAPSSSVIPVEDLMFEHRTYLPVACLAIAAAALLPRLHRPLRAPVVVALLVVLLLGTIARNRVWRDERSLWTDVVEKSPRKARGYFQLGQTYASQDPARARQRYESGLEIEPESPIGHTNLGLVLLSQDDTEGALAHLRKALALDGDRPLVWNNIGAAELRRGDVNAGIQSFRRALEIDACRFDARWNLIDTLSTAGADNEALQAAQVPANCHFLPEQAQKLEDQRRSLH